MANGKMVRAIEMIMKFSQRGGLDKTNLKAVATCTGLGLGEVILITNSLRKLIVDLETLRSAKDLQEASL